MTSLLSGVERGGMAHLTLPDGSAAAAALCAPCDDDEPHPVPAVMSATAAVFQNYDRKAAGHVARLRKLQQASEEARFAGGAPGQRLGQAPGGAGPAAARGTAAGGAAAGATERPTSCTPLVPHTPPRAAAGGRPRVAAPRPAAGGAGTKPVGRAVEKLTNDELRARAAHAAEHRAGATAAAIAPASAPPQPPAMVPSAPREGGRSLTSRHAPGGTHRAGGVGRQSSARGPRGQAKVAVAAARRERAAEAAEARMMASMMASAD